MNSHRVCLLRQAREFVANQLASPYAVAQLLLHAVALSCSCSHSVDWLLPHASLPLAPAREYGYYISFKKFWSRPWKSSLRRQRRTSSHFLDCFVTSHGLVPRQAQVSDIGEAQGMEGKGSMPSFFRPWIYTRIWIRRQPQSFLSLVLYSQSIGIAPCAANIVQRNEWRLTTHHQVPLLYVTAFSGQRVLAAVAAL